MTLGDWLIALGTFCVLWHALVGVVCSALDLVCCNASTAIGDKGDIDPPDYSELHPYWENMEKIKREWNNGKDSEGSQESEPPQPHS